MSTMNNFQFATIFANKRKEMNATQEDIARYVGVSRAAVSKWEKGLSYPDILLLPKLAAYFNVSIDDLLGYEPQMTEQRILEIYANLSKRFATNAFCEVDAEIEMLVTEYYACFPFLLKMVQLYVNYLDVAVDRNKTLEKALTLCTRVKEYSGDYKLANEALMLEGVIYVLQGHPAKVLELLGEDVSIQLGTEQLIATAQKMLGNADKAKEILQVHMYQQILSIISSAGESLILELDKPDYFDEIVRRIETILTTFNMAQLNVNTVLVFYVQAASGYAMLQRFDEAYLCIERYVKACMQIEFPLRIAGDSYFYLLDDWIDRELVLSTQMPRDNDTVKNALYETIANNPLFKVFESDVRYKNLLMNLKHYLRLEGV